MNKGQLTAKLYDILHAGSDPTMKDRIERETQYQYFELCREISWGRLRCEPVTLDFSAISSGGIQLPSDLFGIDLVWDSTNGVEFIPKDRAIAQIDEWGNRYYLKPSATTDFGCFDDLILDKGAATFTSADLTTAATDPDGEYAVFDDEPGFYEITNSATPFSFTPTYYGENKRYKTLRIRPWETTWDMVIIDEDEEDLFDRDVYVYYWRAPQPLYRDSDIIILPSADILFLRILRAIPQSKQLYPVSERMLDEALRKAIKLNPRFPRIAAPRDKRGNLFDMGTNLFEER